LRIKLESKRGVKKGLALTEGWAAGAVQRDIPKKVSTLKVKGHLRCDRIRTSTSKKVKTLRWGENYATISIIGESNRKNQEQNLK